MVPETASSSGQKSWFTDDETKILITIRKENLAGFQAKKKIKFKEWESLTADYNKEVTKPSKERDVKSIQNRIKHLLGQHKKVKDREFKSGSGYDVQKLKTEFPFFDDIDDVVGQRDILNLSHVLSNKINIEHINYYQR